MNRCRSRLPTANLRACASRGPFSHAGSRHFHSQRTTRLDAPGCTVPELDRHSYRAAVEGVCVCFSTTGSSNAHHRFRCAPGPSPAPTVLRPGPTRRTPRSSRTRRPHRRRARRCGTRRPDRAGRVRAHGVGTRARARVPRLPRVRARALVRSHGPRQAIQKPRAYAARFTASPPTCRRTSSGNWAGTRTTTTPSSRERGAPRSRPPTSR